MAQGVVRRIGDNLMLELPCAMAQSLGLVEGSPIVMEADVERGTLILRKPYYTLDQLPEEQEEIQEELNTYREWLDAPRVGREII